VQADEEEEEKNARRWNKIVVGSDEEEEEEARKKRAPSLQQCKYESTVAGVHPSTHLITQLTGKREKRRD
jgi:hypothetical protein